MNKEAKTFIDAEAACQASSQNLSTILNDSQQAFLMDTLRKSAYDGASRYWIGLYGHHGALSWMSGYPAVPNVYWSTAAEAALKMCTYVDTSELKKLSTCSV